MKGIIDRFDDTLAVIELENKNFISVHKSRLPLNAKEGDVVIINKDSIKLDLEKTIQLEKEIQHLMDDLFE